MQSIHPSRFRPSAIIEWLERIRKLFQTVLSLKRKNRVTAPSIPQPHHHSGAWRPSLPVPNRTTPKSPQSTTGPSSESRQSARPGEQEGPSSPEAE
jgi:hypothetical protein